jgi:hypothetical protein
LRGNDNRNTGLVFQSDTFATTVGNNTFCNYFENNTDVEIKNRPNQRVIIYSAKYDEDNTSGYDVTEKLKEYLKDIPIDIDYTINQSEFKNKYNIISEFKHLKIYYNYVHA